MRHTLTFAAVVFVALVPSALAKPPALERFFPAGGQRGQTVTVTAEGAFERWPVRIWSDASGLTVTAEQEKGKLSVKVSETAEPGVHWVRLYDDEGASVLRPFVVGTLPELNEAETKSEPQSLETPRVTINGRLAKRGEVDQYAVRLKQGETLVVAVDANHGLGSPMDPVLQLATPQGIVLAQNDDDQGLDPLRVFQAPAEGAYHVRLFAFPAVADASIAFAGGPAFVYRLTLTTSGYLDYAYPMAVSRVGPQHVEAHGWNIPNETQRLDISPGASSESVRLAHPRLANTVVVRIEDHPTATETEPNDREHAQSVTLPLTITGRISPARDMDVFQFHAQKGQPLRFRIEARTLGSPLDPVLRVIGKDGKSLVEADDTGKDRDAELSFSAPADGDYRLVVRDLHGAGGDRYVYRLTAARPALDYALSLVEDRFTLTPGKPLNLPVKIERKDGFAGTIEIRVEGLPEGVESVPARSDPKGNSAGSVTLTLSSRAERPVSGAFRIVGTVMGGSVPTRTARIPIAGYEAAASDAWLTVLPPERKK